MESSAASDISGVNYDAESGRLVVQFADGEEYLFVGVPGEVCRSFLEAESRPQFFAQQIHGFYPYNKLR